MEKGFSWAHYSNTPLLHFPGRLLLEHPGVFAPAALGRVHDERTFPQRHAGQAAGNDRDFFAIENEWAQVDVPPLHVVVAERGRARKRHDRLGDVVPRILAYLLLEF